jgi:hypothetical protein
MQMGLNIGLSLGAPSASPQVPTAPHRSYKVYEIGAFYKMLLDLWEPMGRREDFGVSLRRKNSRQPQARKTGERTGDLPDGGV